MPDPTRRLSSALEGRYLIERQLGEGGMATVYLADDLRHERKVALKVLKAELAAAVGAERFLAEIKTTANLVHPHILPLFDSGDADGFLFYVMPYVEGESLKERLDREHQLPVDDAVRIATNVAQALDHAHRKGVVHRDVKPANILLRDGDALVADFGIALALAPGSERLTETGISVGTPEYMSPEQATGDSSVGVGSDVWSLGCVLHEMLVGEKPYGGTTPQAILGKIISSTPDPVTKRRRSVPANVGAVVAKALEKVPSDRFATAQDFAHALADPGFRHGETPGGGRRARLVMTGVAFYLLGLLTWSVLGRGGPDARTSEPVRFVIPGLTTTPLGRTIAISPDGALIAHSTSGASLSVRRVVDFGNSSQLAVSGLQPFFSPDGQSIGYFEGIAQSLMRIPVAGGTSTVVWAGTGARALGASWGADGTIVFANTSGLYRVPADGGESQLLRAPDGQRGELYYSWPAMLPGDEAVLFTIVPEDGESDEDGSIAWLDLESGEITVVLSGGSGARYASTGHLLFTAQGGTLYAAGFDVGSKTIVGERVELPIVGLALVARDRGFGADFDISPDGTLAYQLANDQPATLEWVDRAGRVERLSAPPRRYNYTRVSPDGTQIAVDVGSLLGRDIYIWDDTRETDLRLTNDPGEQFFAEWTPRGDSLYYTSNERGGTFDVFRRAADGTGQAELVLGREAPQMVNDLTPDGGRLLLAEGRPPGDGFDLMALVLEEPVRLDTLLSTPSPEFNADASPDGRFVAYQSNATGQYEVYVVPMIGAARARWKVSIDGGEKPLWSATGDTIFYRSRADSMMAAAVSRTPTFEVEAVAALFRVGLAGFGAVGGRFWDLSPLDGRFLFARRPPAAPSGVHVVLNWTQELDRLMER